MRGVNETSLKTRPFKRGASKPSLSLIEYNLKEHLGGGRMSMFDSTKRLLPDILTDIVKGKIQPPDFQRGWIWDDTHVRSLLISIARSFPVGAVMLLENGGEARFQIRPVENVPFNTPLSAALVANIRRSAAVDDINTSSCLEGCSQDPRRQGQAN